MIKLAEYFRKSWAEIFMPSQNKLLKSIFQWQERSGIAMTMLDDPTAYIKAGYSGNSDVYSIINRIIRMSSQARMALYKIDAQGKWVEVTNHELVKFTRNVNPTMKTADFIQGHLVYKLSIGNSYWYKPALTAGANKGKTSELWLMPSNNVEVLGGESWMNPVGGYNLITNTTVKYEPWEVYHAKFFNPLFGDSGGMYGLSPLKAAARLVSKQNEGETTELKQFQNQSPPYLLYKDTSGAGAFGNILDKNQIDDIEATFKDYSKKVKAGHPKVLPEKFGMLNIGVSPVDLNILESSIEGRRKLCNIYGLQSELFNDKSASTYNNVQEVKKDAWNNCIRPNLDDFASDLTSFLINPVPEYINQGLFFAFDYSEVAELQADYAKMVDWMSRAKYTPNEMREATGAKPIDNPVMNEPWFGMGESPLSAMSSPDEIAPVKNFGDYR